MNIFSSRPSEQLDQRILHAASQGLADVRRQRRRRILIWLTAPAFSMAAVALTWRHFWRAPTHPDWAEFAELESLTETDLALVEDLELLDELELLEDWEDA